MKLVKLISDGGAPVWVNPEHVILLNAHPDQPGLTKVRLAGNDYAVSVKGTPELIAMLLADAVVE